MALDDSRLDNAVWFALAGMQADLGERVGRAARYRPEIGVFAAVEAEDDDALDDLRTLLGPGGSAALRRNEGGEPLGGGLRVDLELPALQMLAPDVDDPDDARVARLGTDDVADMVDLATRTQPGPFLAETHRTGTYFGVRDDAGRLVAMAGERMRIEGATEISAVCVDPDHRGERLGGLMTLVVAAHIQSRGDVALLHVREGNDNAIRLYERLGFTTRRRVMFNAVSVPA